MEIITTGSGRYRLGIVGLASCCVWMVLLLASSARAQVATADIVGTVTDPSGAVVPDAKVTVKNTGTGISRTVQTSKAGDYVVTLLQVGRYQVVIEAHGFKTFVARDLTLAAGDRTRVDAKMELGGASESVEVSAADYALQTDSSTVSTLITSEAVQDLPLNGRNLINLVQLSAGVTAGVSNALANGSRPDDRRQTSAYSANGMADINNNNMIDGMDNNERFIGTVVVKPSIDAIQEVKVSTNLYTAEVGRTAGGVADIITKSGSNKLHGSLYEYLRNDKLDARDYFATEGVVPKNELRQNQFGGSIGGPIFKDKTFFFGDYEGFRRVSGGAVAAELVPTAAEQQQLAAGGDVTLSQSGVVIPANLITSLGKKLFQLFPSPNANGANFNFVSDPNQTQFSHTFDVRIDHHFSAKDSLFGRYSYNHVYTDTPGPFPNVDGVNPGGSIGMNFPGLSTEIAQNLGLDYVHVFRPSLLLELKAAFLRFNNQALTFNGANAATSFGFPCNDVSCINVPTGGALYGLPAINITGYAGIGEGMFTPLFDLNNTFQYQGALTWTHGAHTVKAGLSLIRRQVYRSQSFSARGGFNFDGGVTGDPLGDLLEGLSGSITRQDYLINPHYRSWEPSGYIQDDWRVNRWLTLNLGVRYDIFTPYTEINGYISNFDPAAGVIVSPDLVGINHSGKTAGIKTDFSNLAPRLGFAASLGHGAVLRGGFGMTYFPVNLGPNAGLGNAPFLFGVNCGNPADPYNPPATAACGSQYTDPNGWVLLNGGMPTPKNDITLATNTANYNGTEIDSENPNLRSAYLYQYTLQVEKELGANVLTVGYVGNMGRHLAVQPQINSPVTGVASLGSTAAAYSDFPGAQIYEMETAAVSNYNAFQTSFRRRFSRGLTANVNYTWSHVLTNGEPTGEGGSGVPICQRVGCLLDNPGGQPIVLNAWHQADYGNGDQDIRHRFTMMLTYALPFGKSLNGVAGAIAKGWSIDTATAWQTGMPFTVLNAYSVSGQVYRGGDRPDRVGNPWAAGTVAANPTCDAPTAIHTVAAWFNKCAFMQQTTGTVGNTGRDSLYGPHAMHIDLALAKEIPIWEQMKLQFRAEAFNLTNTPTFAVPFSTEPGPGPPGVMGAITSTATGATPRQLQFALRLTF